MSKINDGGPAFAAMGIGPSDDVYHETGMSLRDYAAIHVDLDKLEFASLDSLLEFIGADAPLRDLTMGEIIHIAAKAAAKVRYAYADALIVERERGGAS